VLAHASASYRGDVRTIAVRRLAADADEAEASPKLHPFHQLCDGQEPLERAHLTWIEIAATQLLVQIPAGHAKTVELFEAHDFEARGLQLRMQFDAGVAPLMA